MSNDEFDLSGCCIGVVEREDAIDGSAVRAGDVILGLASSGLHSNGFSLIRALLAQWDLDLAEPYQARLRRSLGDAEAEAAIAAAPIEEMSTLGEVLLTPTRIYARAVLAARAAVRATRLRTSTASPTSPAAACPGTCRGRCRTVSLRESIPRGGRCRPSCGCSGRSVASTTRSCARRSTVASGWSSSCPGAAVTAATEAMAGFGIVAIGRRRGHDGGGVRRRPVCRGAARGRRLSGRIAVGVSGAGSNLRALAAAARARRARWRDRPRLRRSLLPGTRLGGRAGDRDGARPGRR